MKTGHAGLRFLLSTTIAFAAPAQAAAQTCSEVVAKLLTRTAALNNEAQINSANFLRDEVVGPALEAAKRTLDGTGDPTVAAYNLIQDAREKAQALLDRLNSYDAFFTRLIECQKNGCNMFKFIEDEKARSRLAEAAQDKLNEWVQSLGDSGITAAAERVNKAASIVKNAVSGAQGIAQDGITDAVSCMGQYMQTAQAARADLIDPGATAPGVSAPPPSSGSGLGKALGFTALLGGAVAGGLFVASAVSDLEDYSSITTPTGSPVTVTSPPTSNPTSSANYRYVNWNCGASTQCAAVFGSVTGSIGPICTQALCEAFLRQGGNSSCTVQPIYTPVRTGPAPGTPCINR